jgi:Ser/Thr protein kinase RdoA (MazF antagonist)
VEAVARDAFTTRVRDAIFVYFGLRQSDWQDLGGFESFVFAHPAAKRILRVTHVSHRSLADVDAELEFVSFLKANGAAVSEPVGLAHDQVIGNIEKVEQVGEFVCCQFVMAEGRLVSQADWQRPLFESWGQSIGQFHQLASQYQPVGTKRFDWRADANLDFGSRIPSSETKIHGWADLHLRALRALPTAPDFYGLIHCDAHAGNFFLLDSGLTFFDFDDCCYQWFVFDVATILFGAVLRPWVGDSAKNREAEAKNFLSAFLDGYSKAFNVPAFMLEQMHLFLKLRELSLYAVIHSQMDVNNLEEDFPIKVMKGRQARLEADLPFLEMDFTAL